MGKMDGRVALVTGAAQGIGKAVADKLAAEGATVVTADLNGPGAEAAAPEGGLGMQVDVSSEDDVKRMISDTTSHFGRLDAMVNCAAIVPFVPWDDLDFPEWKRIMSVNLDGLFLCCHYGHKPMREAGYGRIVNICSNVVLAGTPNVAHYVASKGGVLGFTRALAREIGKHGITVNAVAPGLTETEGVMAGPHKEAFEFVQMLQCLPRRGVAADIAPSVAFLASEESGWVTGQLLVADAGMSHN
ncbi:MAG: SDR family oxidoreductase [Actinobacteria bacterium]|nr:SDR family oxidoreductase [Thermoleophilia bacterium]MCB9011505.1 SDR family oxidoreductase [Actinomycetota bacterium]